MVDRLSELSDCLAAGDDPFKGKPINLCMKHLAQDKMRIKQGCAENIGAGPSYKGCHVIVDLKKKLLHLSGERLAGLSIRDFRQLILLERKIDRDLEKPGLRFFLRGKV